MRKKPEGVETIGESAFAWCLGLKHVTLPESLKTIGDRAFDGCSSLDQETVERLKAMNPKAWIIYIRID